MRAKKKREPIVPKVKVTFINEPDITLLAKMVINLYNTKVN